MQEAANARAFVQEVGTWKVGDVRITGIPGSHSDAKANPAAPDIVTYVFEVDGLRIAYFSCDGRRALGPEERAALGTIDVALVTAENYAGLSTARARELMRQLGARVVVPLSHHIGDLEYNNELMAELAGGKLETANGELALSPADLAGAGQRVVHILPTLKP
jgi:L-ascorbate metabolism protein UlaG (beta-lactamase superfamily)